MDFETLQNQIRLAETTGHKILFSKKVLKLQKKVKKGKACFDYAENKNFPLGYIFNFYGKKEFSFCVVDEQLKNNLIKFIDGEDIFNIGK